MALTRVRVGGDIRTVPLNDLVDIAATRQNNIGGRFPDIRQSGNILFAINECGTDLKGGEIAAFDIGQVVPVFFDDDPGKIISMGTIAILRVPDYDPYSEPPVDDTGNFVVCDQFIPEDQGGWVYDSGDILARVQEPEGSGDDFDFCDIDIDLDKPHILRPRPEGIARILQNLGPTDTAGEDWAVIRFGYQKEELLWRATQDPIDDEGTLAWSDSDGETGDYEITAVVPPTT